MDDDLRAIAAECKAATERVLQGSTDDSLDKLVLYAENEDVVG
jgi:hypothetical protein